MIGTAPDNDALRRALAWAEKPAGSCHHHDCSGAPATHRVARSDGFWLPGRYCEAHAFALADVQGGRIMGALQGAREALALRAEVLRLRARAESAEAERDALRAAAVEYIRESRRNHPLAARAALRALAGLAMRPCPHCNGRASDPADDCPHCDEFGMVPP